MRVMRVDHVCVTCNTTTIVGPATTYVNTTSAVLRGLRTRPSESQTARLPWAWGRTKEEGTGVRYTCSTTNLYNRHVTMVLNMAERTENQAFWVPDRQAALSMRSDKRRRHGSQVHLEYHKPIQQTWINDQLGNVGVFFLYSHKFFTQLMTKSLY